jgi:hypothetical protein
MYKINRDMMITSTEEDVMINMELRFIPGKSKNYSGIL